MTEQRRRRAESWRSTGFHHRLQHSAQLRDRVGHHLATVEQVMESLRNELAAAREQTRRLADERDRLNQQLARADLQQTEHAESESRWHDSRQEYQRETLAHQTLEREHQRLRERCAELEQAVTRERDERQILGLELECLQEQVHELQAIIDVLTRADEVGEE